MSKVSVMGTLTCQDGKSTVFAAVVLGLLALIVVYLVPSATSS